MRARFLKPLAESFSAFRDVFANRELRRVQLAWIGSVLGTWSYLIALIVFAYDEGGAAAVGLVGVIRTVPSALAAPFMSVLADRYPRRRVMLLASVARAVAMVLAGTIILVDGPALAVYALAGIVVVIAVAYRPAQAALLPSLARTPGELTAANVATSMVNSVGAFAGPAVGGLLLATANMETVFFATAAAFLWTAFFVGTIRADDTSPVRSGPKKGVRGQALAGFGAIAAEPKLRLLVSLYTAQTLVAGGLSVLIVVTALDLMELSDSGVGFLNSAVGVGGLVGGVAALVLASRKRLASDFATGIILWGAPLALIGFFPEPPIALLLLAFVGIGNTLVDVAGMTLLQRAVPDEVLGRVFGALQSLLVGSMGLGAVLAPILIEVLGIRGALIATGALLPVLAALTWRQLASLDATADVPVAAADLLSTIPIFAPLPPATIEQLARGADRREAPAGTTIVRQGDAGDRFYAIAAGEVDIDVDGRPAAPLGPGDYFGEIALLRDVPRTATVTARTDVELYAVDRDDFIAAVTGHDESEAAAERVVGARLQTLRPIAEPV